MHVLHVCHLYALEAKASRSRWRLSEAAGVTTALCVSGGPGADGREATLLLDVFPHKKSFFPKPEDHGGWMRVHQLAPDAAVCDSLASAVLVREPKRSTVPTMRSSMRSFTVR